MKRTTFLLVIAAFFVLSASAAVRGDDVMYVGGTFATIAEKTEGRLDSSKQSHLVFNAKGGSISIPYKGINSIEYGQKAGRRVGVALAVSPVALFSKKRKHYVSLGFTDDSGTKQGVVFEVAKGRVGSLVTNLEANSGKKVEFESEDAKKHFDKEAK